MSLAEAAAKNLTDTIRLALAHPADAPTLVVFDERAPLARILTDGYRSACPGATFLDFDASTQEQVRDAMFAVPAGGLVVLVQSSSFRLNDFRVRIELFQRGLKTIEHVHLSRMKEEEFGNFVNGLAYDPEYYRPLGKRLAEKIAAAKAFEVHSGEGSVLRYASAMEPVKLNIGDYRGMKNVGGTFPIGEVFTEPSDLTAVSGEVTLKAFAGPDFLMRFPKPFPVRVEAGCIVDAAGAPQEFLDILAKIREDEQPMVREFGLGLNPAFSPETPVADVTAFERMKGMHLSLGAKHTIYKKAGIRIKTARYHIDVFVDARKIMADGETLFENGEYVV